MSARHESRTQPGLFYWAQRNDPPRGIGPVTWVVIAQALGGPATEAHDDWFATEADADAIARQLAAEDSQ